MIVKEISFEEEARKKLIGGVNKIADAVKSTLGARGRTVLIESENHIGGVTITKDGVTVAKSIALMDPTEDLAVRIIREAAEKTATEAGDGTTTAIVLTQAIIAEAQKRIKKEMNLTDIIRNMQDTTDFIIKALDKKKKKITAKKLVDVASISANNDKEIGNIIAKAYDLVGINGVVTVENSDGGDTWFSTSEGMRLKRGYMSRYFITDQKTEECILENPHILVLNSTVENMSSIEHVLADVLQNGKSLLIIGDVDAKVMNTLNLNKVRNGLKVCVIQPPEFGWKKDQMMQDIAIATGATYFSEDTGDNFQLVRLEDLGSARKVIVDNANTVIVRKEDEHLESQLNNHMESLWEMHETSKEQEFIKKRIAMISGKIGVIHVGANSDIEQKEKKDRVDDAVCATRAALEDGILPGGGIALKEIADDLAKLGAGESQRVSMAIMEKALKAPFYQILTNAGIETKLIEPNLDPGTGYDVKNDKYGNMIKLGIIDPCKVTKSAVRNAISIASTILSTNAIITNVREK
jgi:chaperonin GroEL